MFTNIRRGKCSVCHGKKPLKNLDGLGRCNKCKRLELQPLDGHGMRVGR